MKITTLFFRSVLLFQIKVLLAAEKDTQQEVSQSLHTLSESETNLAHSCPLYDDNETTGNVTEEETGERYTTLGAITVDREYVLYKELWINFTEKHGYDVPNFGVNVKEIKKFNDVLSSSDILDYSHIASTEVFHKELENEIKEIMKKHKENFQKSMNKMKRLIQKNAPKVEGPEEVSLKKDYEKFQPLNWSYFNDSIVGEAENVFEDMKWICPIPKQTGVLNVRLYHELHKLINDLKDNILNLNRHLKHFKLLSKSYSRTVRNALLRPLSMFLPTDRKDIFEKLHLELIKFNEYCDDALKTEDKRLSDNNNYSDLIDVTKNVITHLDEHVRMYSKVITTALKNEKGKGNDLIISLFVHFFKFLKDSNVEQQKILNAKWELNNKNQLEKILKILKKEKFFLDTRENSSLETLKKIIRKTPNKKQLEHSSNNLTVFAKYYMKILVLLKFKNELTFLLDYLKNNINIHALGGEPSKEQLPTEKSTYEVISESGTDTIKTVLDELSKIVSNVIDMVTMEEILSESFFEEMKMHSLIRELQFHLGSACSIFSKMREKPGYKKHSEEYTEALKKMLHCFWNANNAIQIFYEDKQDS